MPAARKKRLTTSGMLAGASGVMATQRNSRQSKRLQSREPRHSRDIVGGTEDRRRELPTGLPNGVRVTEPCLTAWPDKLPVDSRIPPPEGSRDPRSSKEPRLPWTASRRWSEGETAQVDSSNFLAETLAHLGQEGVRIER
jgi:hypothetical protein